MTGPLEEAFYAVPVDHDRVRADWAGEEFSFGTFRDPPGQEWNGFVHDCDEYVVVAEGRLEVAVGDARVIAGPGDRLRIPRGVVHSLKTVSATPSVWLYGYGNWRQSDE